ncbi:MAG: cytochrome d ubiquinol oxidase subunit II [Streptomycetaceae bacterium]|nr:cytochrome d ubiquinol oxidase subunit II [Streptomycetaceae bacterium]
MELTTVWFILIAVLWIGYFFLEGFDFGVGVLTKALARDETERRVLINTIGPVWDGNEVWLLTAGGATFAAFPDWYATLFSGFYLPLLLILVALIVRGVAFEYRAKRDDAKWKRNWENAIFYGSLVPAFLWGVAFANIVRGVKIDADKEYAGNLLDLLNPYALLGGLVTLTLFTFHGAVFVGLKTVGDIRERANALAFKLGLATAVLAAAFLVWTQVDSGNGKSLAALAVAVAALLAALACNRIGREGWTFVFSGVTVIAAVAMLFLALFPNVMPSSIASAYNLTTDNAASSPYTLKIMTWVAAIMTPIVLCYQGWTYWVFRKRIGTQHIPTSAPHGAAG